ncbi:Tn3 family transposase [Streptomyces sp. NPDC089915]|uniref:Tn3 family transposase n=1 Tax=Streptomyces sp. NPDC089915 TaxID=3155186 RepID=UPI0034395E59
MTDNWFLSDEDVALYGAVPKGLTQQELQQYFVLDEDDLQTIAKLRGPENRLGYAVLQAGLRFSGRFSDPQRTPADVVKFLAHQLDVDPAVLGRYGARDATARAHKNQIKNAGRWQEFDGDSCRDWLAAHMWITGAGPRNLFYAGVQELRGRRMLLPGLSTLARLVMTVRAEDWDRVCRLLLAAPTPKQIEVLQDLLRVPEGANLSELGRIRRRPRKSNSEGVEEALRRAATVRSWGFHGLDIGVPPRRVAQVARSGGEARVSRTARLASTDKTATTVATVVSLSTSSIDDALNVFHDHMDSDIVRKAKRAAEKALRDALPELVAALGTLDQVTEVWTAGRDELVDAASGEVKDGKRTALEHYTRMEQLAPPPDDIDTARATARRHHPGTGSDPDEAWRAELVKGYKHVADFLPLLPVAIDFRATPDGAPVLAALKALPALMIRAQVGRDEIDLTLVRGSWRKLVLAAPGNGPETIHTEAYAMCILTQFHEQLNSRDIYALYSSNWGNPDAQLMSDRAWEREKPALLTNLHLAEDPQELLAEKSSDLDRSFRRVAQGFPDNAHVSYDRRGKLRISNSHSDPQHDPAPLQAAVIRSLPRVDLPEVLLTVLQWAGADRICTTPAGACPRAKDFNTTFAALLVAYGCNVGYDLVTGHSPALRRSRLKEVERDYLTPKNIEVLSKRMIELQADIPLARLMGGGEVAAVDGMRFYVPPRSPFGHRGEPRRTATWFTVVTDQAAGRAGMVVSGSPATSLYVLDVLGERTTDGPTTIVADARQHGDIVFGLLTLAGYHYAPRYDDIPEKGLWHTQPAGGYGPLQKAVKGRIDMALIERHWPRVLRVIGSIHHGTVRAHDIIRMLTQGANDSLGQAIAHYGRIAKSQHILRLIEDTDYRNTIQSMATLQHDRQKLARKIHHGRDGHNERYHPGMETEVGALGLVLNAVVLHTTCLTDQTLNDLRASGHPVHNEAAAQLSPFTHDHINLRGRYTFEFKEVTNGPRFAPDSGSAQTD